MAQCARQDEYTNNCIVDYYGNPSDGQTDGHFTSRIKWGKQNKSLLDPRFWKKILPSAENLGSFICHATAPTTLRSNSYSLSSAITSSLCIRGRMLIQRHRE
jgi:hypothetical protein